MRVSKFYAHDVSLFITYYRGPGWLVCIAYIDPGNYQANIQGK